MTILEAMARGRIEWLAQGLLVHALQNDDGVHDLVAKRCGIVGTRADLILVEEERPAASGWRSDIRVLWRGQAERLLELKIAADLSANQLGALRVESLSLLVAPRIWHESAGAGLQVVRVSWQELSTTAKDPTLQSLFLQAEEAGATARASLSVELAARDFEGFLAGTTWRAMYRFLVGIDRALSGELGPEYQASTQWSFSRGSLVPYYGFSFTVGNREVSYWIGLARDAGTAAPNLRVTTSAPKEQPWMEFGWGKRGELGAADVAREFHERMER